ncbi:hypothetical protein GCM10029963_70150 [Micromonospora andamanensis]
MSENTAPAGGKAAVADIEEAMKDVVDPELGINVVDLGLVYGVHVDDQNVATLDMTLTSAACPLTDVIEDQARQALTTGPGGGLVDDIRINWVWLPRGDRTRSPTRVATSSAPSGSTSDSSSGQAPECYLGRGIHRMPRPRFLCACVDGAGRRDIGQPPGSGQLSRHGVLVVVTLSS